MADSKDRAWGLGIVYQVYDEDFNVIFAAETFQDEVFAADP
jgi:hypothetical protein